MVIPLTGQATARASPEAKDRERYFIELDICTNLIFLKLLQLLYCQKLRIFFSGAT